MHKISRFLPLVFLFFSFIVVLLWFRDGSLLAAGEEGMALYKPSLTLEVYKSLWYETGTGNPMPATPPRISFMALTAIFNILVSNWLAQAIVFGLLIFSGIFGVYLLAKELVRDKRAAVFSALFYFLNLYSLSQVWMRLLYTGIFTWAYLPLFLFLVIKLIRNPKLWWLLLFVTTSFVFSASYGHPAFVVTLWAPAVLFAIIEIYREKNRINKVKIFKKFASLCLGWGLINLWWIYPYMTTYSNAFSEISDWKYNFDSLRGVSQFFNSDQLFTLRQGFLFGKDGIFYSFYSHPIVHLASIVVFLVAIFGWIKSKNTKNWIFLTSLALLGWFVSKGTNPPLGHIFFETLFSKFSFAAPLRNPYEKFGDVWLLSYSIFFGLGLAVLQKRAQSISQKVFVGILIFIAYIFLVWPMWTGDLFRPHRVTVPDYYEKANNYLNSQNDVGRIIMLPIIYGDSVHYGWGYKGLEPSEFIFDKPAVSKMLRTKYFDEKYISLHDAFVNGDNYNEFLDQMNITHMVLHEDLVFENSLASSSAEVKKRLNSNPQIRFLRKEGELLLYKYESGENSKLFKLEGLEGSEVPNFNYQKNNTRFYVVNIVGAQKPYQLIFKETYNDLWVARINGWTLEDHFLVYEYANAWRIDKIGDYQIEIIFKVWPWE